MAAPNQQRVYRATGRLIIGATDFADPFPHGGTELGASSRVRLDVADFSWPDGAHRAEEFAGLAVDVVKLQGNPILTATIRQWDDDVKDAFFETSTGASSGEKYVRIPGGVRSGRLLAQDAVKVSFVAHRSTHPSVHFKNAIAVLDADEAVPLSLIREMAYVVHFIAIPDSSGELSAWGLAEDLAA